MSSAWPDYELLDFGAGRRLERFAEVIASRPAPGAAEVERAHPGLWRQATARFEIDDAQRGGQRGVWLPADALPASWTIACGPLKLELKPTDFGHLGVFPEQWVNWQWIGEQVRAHNQAAKSAARVLNLFAYTGGSTLAAAAAGAEVTHVDSSRAAVNWARRNAELSGLSGAPIRWIVEDAARYVERELARGRNYDAVILDPPSYGHGPARESWKLEDHLPTLLQNCAELTRPGRLFVLLTCHTPSVTPPVAAGLLGDALGFEPKRITARPLTIGCADGRKFPCGIVAIAEEA